MATRKKNITPTGTRDPELTTTPIGLSEGGHVFTVAEDQAGERMPWEMNETEVRYECKGCGLAGWRPAGLNYLNVDMNTPAEQIEACPKPWTEDEQQPAAPGAEATPPAIVGPKIVTPEMIHELRQLEEEITQQETEVARANNVLKGEKEELALRILKLRAKVKELDSPQGDLFAGPIDLGGGVSVEDTSEPDRQNVLPFASDGEGPTSAALPALPGAEESEATP